MKYAFLLIASLLTCLTAHSATQTYEGALEGAPYVVAKPEQWEGGKAFFHVHGWRPAESPHLADLNLEDPLYQQLVAEGWLIGRTAFYENGVDHDAHTRALRDLKAWIESELGPIETLILEGESTAGTLVLRIAEIDPDLADGVIALAPFIDLENPELDSYLTANPKLPNILMSNLSEITGPVAYAAAGAEALSPPALRPLLRPGHVNVNWAERWEAVRVLDTWIQTDESPGFTNGTRTVPDRATGTETIDGHLVNAVIAVNPFYGNAFLGYHPDEFTAAGFSQGDTLEIEAKGKVWPVLFGSSYGDVAEGEWVAFPTADETIMLVRNHKSAIATAGLEVGDPIRIKLPE